MQQPQLFEDVDIAVRRAAVAFLSSTGKTPLALYLGQKTKLRLMQGAYPASIHWSYIKPGTGRDMFMGMDVYLVDADEHIGVA